MQSTLTNTLVAAIRDLLPIACDGVTARDTDAVDTDDQDAADAAQIVVEHARKLLHAPAVLAACALEHAQRLYAIRTTNAGNGAGSWAESVELTQAIIEAARMIELHAIARLNPVEPLVDPIPLRVGEDGPPVYYSLNEPCEYCGALAGEPCAPDCLSEPLAGTGVRGLRDDEPWATAEGDAARAKALRQGEQVFWGWLAVILLTILAGVLIVQGGAP